MTEPIKFKAKIRNGGRVSVITIPKWLKKSFGIEEKKEYQFNISTLEYQSINGLYSSIIRL